jgi:5-methylcytosine-specific restriction endonuclease McrA
MIQFFLTGELPNYDLPPTFSSTEILSKLAQRQTFMKTRCQRKRGDGSQVVTVEELINLCSAKKGQCAITGWTCFLHDNRRSRLPYWALSFDHIMPICHSYFRPEAWSIANIQIMCSGINTVKGNYSDEEVKRWYKRFLDSQVIELYWKACRVPFFLSPCIHISIIIKQNLRLPYGFVYLISCTYFIVYIAVKQNLNSAFTFSLSSTKTYCWNTHVSCIFVSLRIATPIIVKIKAWRFIIRLLKTIKFSNL